jgi:branched-subunit amino acid aminotransferase/4-amino-4-deoxychorismate lyase
MAAAFATNTSIGVRAIAAIDHAKFPVDHPALEQLRDAYLSISGETP